MNASSFMTMVYRGKCSKVNATLLFLCIMSYCVCEVCSVKVCGVKASSVIVYVKHLCVSDVCLNFVYQCACEVCFTGITTNPSGEICVLHFREKPITLAYQSVLCKPHLIDLYMKVLVICCGMSKNRNSIYSCRRCQRKVFDLRAKTLCVVSVLFIIQVYYKLMFLKLSTVKQYGEL